MRIAISHTTHYRFETPAWHGVQRLRLKPRDCAMQTVSGWSLTVEGGQIETEYEDHNLNTATLVSFGADARDIMIRCGGVVETRDTAGVIGKHTGFLPLWAFLHQTELTRPGPRLAQLAARFAAGAGNGDIIPLLHDLSEAILAAVRYEIGRTDADTSAEAALTSGHGVCQDHAHIFIGAARALGVPARYVSGYLLMEGISAQDAGHGWAEAHVQGLGWVGFDIANAISPDQRYVRLAVGTDYRDAAPVTGLLRGGGASDLTVSLQVEQQVAAQ